MFSLFIILNDNFKTKYYKFRIIIIVVIVYKNKLKIIFNNMSKFKIFKGVYTSYNVAKKYSKEIYFQMKYITKTYKELKVVLKILIILLILQRYRGFGNFLISAYSFKTNQYR